MSHRYFEIIITGKQLAALLATLVAVIFVAFGLGVAVSWMEPPPVVPVAVASIPVSALPGPSVELVEPTPVAVAVETPPALVEAAAVVEPTAAAPATPLIIAPTRVPTRVPPPTVAPSPSPVAVPEAAGGFWVQVAAVSRPDLAEGVKQRVMAFGYQPEQLRVLVTPAGLFKIRVGPFPDLESAGRVVARLQEGGFEKPFLARE